MFFLHKLHPVGVAGGQYHKKETGNGARKAGCHPNANPLMLPEITPYPDTC